MLEQHRALFIERFRQPKMPLFAARSRAASPALPCALRAAKTVQIVAVEMQQVEGVIDHALGASSFRSCCSREKLETPSLALDDQFAVDHCRLDRKLCERICDRLEIVASSRDPCASTDALAVDQCGPGCDSRRT